MGENDVPKVKIGDSAIVTIDAYNNQKFKGIVTQISSSNNGASTQSDLTNTSTEVTNYKVFVRLLPKSYVNLISKGSFPFKPGMTASADIQTQVHTNVLSVPINAVTTRSKMDSMSIKNKVANTNNDAAANADELDLIVFVLDKEKHVKKVLVKTSIQDINYIEITNGLKEGDEVITGPYDVVSKILKEGDKVIAVDKKDLYNTK